VIDAARRIFRRFVGDPFDANDAQAFAVSCGATNVARLRALLPLMAVVHVVHAIAYHLSPEERASLAPNVVAWKDGVVAAHLGTLALGVPLAIAMWTLPRRRDVGASFARVAGVLAAILYLGHGAVCTGFDQLAVANVSAYTGYALGTAVVLALAPPQTLLVYAVGIVAFLGALFTFQADANVRESFTLNGVTLSLVGVGLSLLLHATRRRDFSQRTTIERQRAQLASMNTALEKRVQEQVHEIVKKADEVQHLNTQLQVRVRDRSNELSLALAQLALRRDVDGTLTKGKVLGDRFEIDALIGTGGMGSVYAGLDRSTSTRVAIKVIQAASARQLDALHRFLREAKSAATIAHPAVVRALHVDIADDGLLYQVQELVPGVNLEQWLTDNGPASPAVAARIMAVLCDALAAAHDAGVVHRDVKPSNAMLTKSAPGLKLLDFGIAKLVDPAASLTTDRGFVLGTPAYMAPEQHSGDDEITGAVDVYAAGVLLHRMLAGRLPKEQRTQRVRQQTPPTPTRSEPFLVEPTLAIVVEKCRARDPADRPTARELAHDFAKYADEHSAPSLVDLL
jgi:serine/threonine-protein kinase